MKTKFEICNISKAVLVNGMTVLFLDKNGLGVNICRDAPTHEPTTGINLEKKHQAKCPIYTEARRLFFETFM